MKTVLLFLFLFNLIITALGEIPSGYFFIRMTDTNKVVDVSGGSKEPGAAIILWEIKQTNFDNQLWKYENGYIMNKASGLVLEIPGYEDGRDITPETPLIQASQRKGSESKNQLWSYNLGMLKPYDPKLCLSTQDGNFINGERIVVEYCRYEDPTFQWILDSV